jgi:MoxR-like ATPase
VSEALGWSFKRIQFTPDLMLADITGTEILYEDRTNGVRELRFAPGPVFANLVLADEINRTPPKTQAALLEAMQERSVTAGGHRHLLPDPFFVLATQNPIEQEGTYHLPEAQLDRFLLGIEVDYPDERDELAIATLDVRNRAQVKPVLSIEEFRSCADLVASIPVPGVAVRYAVSLVRASRPTANAQAWVREHVGWGAGPRASQHLIAASRALAALSGRTAVDPSVVAAAAPLVLAHRVVPSFQAAGLGITGRDIVTKLLKLVQA